MRWKTSTKEGYRLLRTKAIKKGTRSFGPARYGPSQTFATSLLRLAEQQYQYDLKDKDTAISRLPSKAYKERINGDDFQKGVQS